MEPDEKSDFRSRPYQEAISEIAYKKNTIIYLPTGSGKTFIAIMLLKRMSHEIMGADAQKKSVFLVNTVPLVEQHCATIERHTYFAVGKYSGEQNCDLWSEDDWDRNISKYQVLVLTAQIFLDIIRHHYFSLDRVNLLVFDECHQGVADQPMRQLMQLFGSVPMCHHPRVLGLTATLLNGNCAPVRVMREVEKLETTFHSKVATVGDMAEVIGYSTNAEEAIITFEVEESCPREHPALQQLYALIAQLHELRIETPATSPESGSPAHGLQHLDGGGDGCPHADIAKMVLAVCEQEQVCGMLGGARAALATLISVEHMKRRTDSYPRQVALSLAATALISSLNLFNHELDLVAPCDQVYAYSSKRVLTLIEVLRKHRGTGEQFCGLIFVEKRFTAKVLYYVLKTLAETDPEFSDLRPNFIVGFNAPGRDRFSRENLYACKQNRRVLQNFRHHETNLLVASSVLEEGVDIPACSLVIRFDRPLNYRSYMQSKGRARHRYSNFVTMVPVAEYDGYMNKYEQFQTIERMLHQYLTGQNDLRRSPTQETIERELYEEPELEPYYVGGPGSAHVSMLSAISLLNRYCQSLQRDRYTDLVPNWYCRKMVTTQASLLQVVIEMPVACPIREDIKGVPMKNKVNAKRAAALEACKRLHQIGQLNNRLLPQMEELTIDLDFLCIHWAKHEGEVKPNEPRPGTNKYVRNYPKCTPEVLFTGDTSLSNNTYYLHIIEMTALFDATEIEYKLYIQKNLIESDLGFGLLTLKPLPQLCDFPVFISPGEVQVHIAVNQQTVELHHEDVMCMRRFNYRVFHDVLNVLREFYVYDNSANGCQLLLAPVRRLSTGHYTLATDLTGDHLKIQRVSEPSIQEKEEINVTDEGYVGKIVSTWYRDLDKQYVVSRVCWELNAHSPFPSKDFQSYAAYYSDRYGVKVMNPEQPLLLVKPMSKRLNCVLPRAATLHKRKKQELHEGCDEHLVPEMCVLQQFPSTLWYKAALLPTILHRVNRLLQMEQLRTKIYMHTGFGVLELAPGARWDPLPVDPKVLHKEDKKPVPVPNRDVGDADAPALPEPKKKQTRLINKDYSDRMIERLYPWKDKQEPMDIERNMELVTAVGLDDYERFCNEAPPIQNEEMRLASICSVHGPNPLALGLEQMVYRARPIALLARRPSPLGPQQWQLLQATTAASATDIVNLERLETLGDSFLKLAASLHLFLRFPNYPEGLLTLIKSRIIGNRNLLYCALEKNLGEYIQASEFSASNDWVPPGWVVPTLMRDKLRDKQLSINKLFEMSVPMEAAVAGDAASVQLGEVADPLPPYSLDLDAWSANRYLERQTLRDKTVSDSVEAMLGAYLEAGGIRGGLHLLDYFDIIPQSEDPLTLFTRSLPPALLRPGATAAEVDVLLHEREQLEAALGYTFRDRSYLLQALTHASFCVNRLTDCYQRLEFLGDAVLDFLITCHVYERGANLTPGQLTDLRSALVNNVTFACLAVRCGFHKSLMYINSRLNDVIDSFVKLQVERNHIINEDVLTLLEDDPLYMAEQVHVPKALGDVFESLAGAVFLDSGMDLCKTWEVLHKIMYREIDQFLENTPRNPVRLLYEYEGAAPQFTPSQYMDNGTVMVSCAVMVDGQKRTVVGVGENKKHAKRAAAKMGLNLLA